MATLYRKYRPQTFEEVVGQNHIKLTLEYELKSDKLAHSYLFCGPRAVGKTTLARVLAKSLNCLNRPSDSAEPCNECRACVDITAGRSMDIMEIDAASHTGVDNVRDNIIANARITPSSLKYKVFIIDEVHMLSSAAFNALLKIMEEPPEYIVFILCTTEVHKIPATVISRCQRFDFKKISVIDIIKKLQFIAREENLDVEKEVLEAVARHCGGHMRDAESVMGQIITVADSKTITMNEAELVVPRNDLNEVFNLLELVIAKDSSSAIRLINRLLDNGYDLKVFSNALIEMSRQLLLVKINPEIISALGIDLGESLTERLGNLSRVVATSQALKILERFIKAQAELRDAFIIQLPLEMAVVDLSLETVAPRPATNSVNTNVSTQNINVPVVLVQTAGPISPGQITLEEVMSRWSEFLTMVKKVNHSLSFVLKVCQPTDVTGNELCLTFRHKIHRDRISEVDIKPMVESVLREVYNKELQIKAILDESLVLPDATGDIHTFNVNSMNQEPSAPVADEAIDNILRNFGGKVVG